MVFGTFDGLHPGHLNFFRQAKKLKKNSILIVSIARDRNVKKIKKALPRLPEAKRLALVKKNPLVDAAVLGSIQNHIPHIVRARPDIIALGYDQRHYVKNLKKDLQKKGLLVKIVRLKPYRKSIFKNHLLSAKGGSASGGKKIKII